MFKKIVFGLLGAIVLFLGYASTKDSQFRYERSGVINASADKIFPFISNFKNGLLWSPYEMKDPKMKRNYIGTDGQVGAIEEFDGNMEAGSGKLEILKVVPNELVQIRLLMTKPMAADHTVEYKLTPEGDATRMTWAMYGDGGFVGKVMTTLIDCEKMVAGDMEVGIRNLKTVVENQVAAAK